MKTFKFEDFDKLSEFGFSLYAKGKRDESEGLTVQFEIESEAEFDGFRKGLAVRDVNLNLNLNLDLNLNLNLYLRSFTTVWISPNRSRSSPKFRSSS